MKKYNKRCALCGMPIKSKDEPRRLKMRGVVLKSMHDTADDKWYNLCYRCGNLMVIFYSTIKGGMKGV